MRPDCPPLPAGDKAAALTHGVSDISQAQLLLHYSLFHCLPCKNFTTTKLVSSQGLAPLPTFSVGTKIFPANSQCPEKQQTGPSRTATTTEKNATYTRPPIHSEYMLLYRSNTKHRTTARTVHTRPTSPTMAPSRPKNYVQVEAATVRSMNGAAAHSTDEQSRPST